VINIQIDIDREQVEDALVDLGTWADTDFIALIVSTVERVGDPSIAKSLIDRLGDTHAYLEEVFGGAE